jgi:hypothetical protein
MSALISATYDAEDAFGRLRAIVQLLAHEVASLPALEQAAAGAKRRRAQLEQDGATRIKSLLHDREHEDKVSGWRALVLGRRPGAESRPRGEGCPPPSLVPPAHPVHTDPATVQLLLLLLLLQNSRCSRCRRS